VEEMRKNIRHRVTGCMALIETVAQGNVDAAIGWSSFENFHPNITAIPLPEKYRIYRSTCVAILDGTPDPLIAASFIEFLCSPEGREFFREQGWIFDVPDGRRTVAKGEDH